MAALTLCAICALRTCPHHTTAHPYQTHKMHANMHRPRHIHTHAIHTAHTLHSKARCTYLNHVLSYYSDLLQITTHLVVQERKPVSHPENELAARLGEFVYVNGFQNTLFNSNEHSVIIFRTLPVQYAFFQRVQNHRRR